MEGGPNLIKMGCCDFGLGGRAHVGMRDARRVVIAVVQGIIIAGGTCVAALSPNRKPLAAGARDTHVRMPDPRNRNSPFCLDLGGPSTTIPG